MVRGLHFADSKTISAPSERYSSLGSLGVMSPVRVRLWNLCDFSPPLEYNSFNTFIWRRCCKLFIRLSSCTPPPPSPVPFSIRYETGDFKGPFFQQQTGNGIQDMQGVDTAWSLWNASQFSGICFRNQKTGCAVLSYLRLLVRISTSV